MPDEKPEYRVYRARGGLLSRLLNRRESQRFRPLERRQGPAQPAGQAPRAGTATVEPPPREPGRAPEGPPREPTPPVAPLPPSPFTPYARQDMPEPSITSLAQSR